MNLNFASRLMCYKCGSPPSFQNPNLQQHFAALSAWGYGGLGGPGGYGAPPMGFGGKGAARPGDWMCPGCNNHNYANRVACNRCQAAKPPNAEAPPSAYGAYALPMAGGSAGGKMRPGDWICAGCSNHNFASRLKCNRCQTDRPADIATANGLAAGLPQPY